MWKLGNEKIPGTFAIHSQGTTYPLGKNYWQVGQDCHCRFRQANILIQVVDDPKCNYQDANSVFLNLSPCNASSFTCDNGICISMTKR